MANTLREEINIENGRLLYKYRKENHIKIDEMCKIIGFGRTSLSMFEKGLRSIPTKALQIIRDKLKLSLKEPIYLTPENAPKKYNNRKRTKIPPIINYADGLKGFANRLAVLRLNSRYNTLEAFADRYDLSVAHLWKLEQGGAITLRVTTLQKLAKDGYDINELICGPDFKQVLK